MLIEIANYADDNSPFAIAPTIPQVISQLEQESVSLLKWIRNNGLKANPDKFHLLLSDPSEDFSIKIDNLEIENSKCQNLCLVGK